MLSDKVILMSSFTDKGGESKAINTAVCAINNRNDKYNENQNIAVSEKLRVRSWPPIKNEP